MTIAAPAFQDTKLARLINDVSQGNRILWLSSMALGAGLIVSLVLMMIDHRLFNGVDVWDKPAKFFLSLLVQMATVSWALMQIPEAQRKSRGITVAVWVMTICAWGELLYMIFRASRGEASHFNGSSTFAAVAYTLMGYGAVSITASSGFVGWRVWRNRKLGLWTEAAGLGLLVGMVLGTLTGAYIGAQTSHWVGGELTDAHGVGFFGWSTTGGDLRVAHFVGFHAAQLIPFAALSGSRWIVYGTALACIVMTAAVFTLGISGLPLFAA
jgi:hypothetical protein